MKKKLKDFYAMVEELETAMFTTRRRDGYLVSRPMATQVQATGADLWFCTYRDAAKLKEIERDAHVNLSYYKDRTREWISVSGMAKISTNRRKIHELYRPDWRAWFGDEGGVNNGGPDDPRIVLVGVDIHTASFMEVNKPQAVVLFELVKGMITGTPPKIGTVRSIQKKDAPSGASAAKSAAKRSSKKSTTRKVAARKASPRR